MSSQRAAGLVAALAVAGVAISAYIAHVHGQIAAAVVPSCDVSETVSCSVVLSSSYAYLFGTIPVAWAALATYVGFAALAAAMAFALPRAASRRRVANMLFAGATGAAVYSVYLAGVAVFVLGAVCLLCTGLYVVNAGLLVATGLLLNAVRSETQRGREADGGLVRWVGAGAGVGLAVVLGLMVWEATSGGAGEPPADFVRWYDARPVIAQPPRDGHSKGDAESPVVIAEFSDFECGHCAQVYRTFKKILPRYRDVRVEFFHFPLDSSCNPAIQSAFHQNACLAAAASECASTQGKFWPYHDLLFDNQKELGRDNLIRFAEQVGLDRDTFSKCLDSDEARAAVARDVAEGSRLEVQSTPTLFINQRLVRGALQKDKLEYAIHIERERSTRSN